MSRDRDVRNAIQTALIQTGAFDAVWLWGMPEDYGTGASNLAVAAIESMLERASRSLGLRPGGRPARLESRQYHTPLPP